MAYKYERDLFRYKPKINSRIYLKFSQLPFTHTLLYRSLSFNQQRFQTVLNVQLIGCEKYLIELYNHKINLNAICLFHKALAHS
jgi:hypothetical protein